MSDFPDGELDKAARDWWASKPLWWRLWWNFGRNHWIAFQELVGLPPPLDERLDKLRRDLEAKL